MPAPEWVAENWPGSATVHAVRCKGTRDGKAVDETVTKSPVCTPAPSEGLTALVHHIRGLLALLGWREPAQALSSA
jgi:hypothetical protein